MPDDPPVDEDEKEIQDAQDEFEKDMEVWDRLREEVPPWIEAPTIICMSPPALRHA